MGAIENMDKVHNLIGLLEAWAEWQKGYKVKLGYPKMSAGFQPGGYNATKTFDELADESDAELCRMVDYCVQDLSPVHSAAIYRRYLAALFRSERVRYVDALAEAHVRLLEMLPTKGVVL